MSATVTREEFLRILERQRAEYWRTADGKIADMELLWDALAEQPASAEDLARLERTAHMLAGSGAVFGYDKLSTEARTLEQRLSHIVEGGAGLDGTERSAVGASIAALRECL
jgi:HPt (histidine-containing phosphotransfer) domain-containing protein